MSSMGYKLLEAFYADTIFQRNICEEFVLHKALFKSLLPSSACFLEKECLLEVFEPEYIYYRSSMERIYFKYDFQLLYGETIFQKCIQKNCEGIIFTEDRRIYKQHTYNRFSMQKRHFHVFYTENIFTRFLIHILLYEGLLYIDERMLLLNFFLYRKTVQIISIQRGPIQGLF